MDAVALSDSVATVLPIATFLTASFPWLDAQIVNWVAHSLGALPIVGLIMGWEIVGRWLNKLSPTVKKHIGDRLAQFSWAINPALGALIGGNMGDSSLGLVAGALWGMIKKSPIGGTTTFGLAKARNVALIAAGLLYLGVGSVGAEPAKPNPVALKVATFATTPEGKHSLLSRLTYGVGVGQRFVRYTDDGYTHDNHTFIAGQVGYTISDFIGLRARLDKNVSKVPGSPWNVEIGLWGVF